MNDRQTNDIVETWDLTAAIRDDLESAISNIPQRMIRGTDADAPDLDPELSREPWVKLRALRQSAGDVVPYRDGCYGDLPVYNLFGHPPGTPTFIVLGYETLKQVSQDKQNFVNSGAYGLFQSAMGIVTLNALDGEEHRVLRRLFDTQVFSKQKLMSLSASTITPMAEYLVKRIRGKLEDGEPVDLCRDLAIPLTFSTMAQIIGLPLRDLNFFIELAEEAFGGVLAPEEAAKASGELRSYFSQLYQTRRADGELGRSDLMSLMGEAEYDGRRLSDDEVVEYCQFLLPAGIETTWRQLANLTFALMTNIEEYRKVVADPQKIPDAVEESFRWMPSGYSFPRMTADEVTVAGVTMPANAAVYCIFGMANRDERIWPDPDRFDISRQRRPHFTFNFGSHACLGQHLARLNLTSALKALVSHVPDLVLADGAKPTTGGLSIRAPYGVPVALDPRSSSIAPDRASA